jgi:hypothetical protein
MDRSKDLAGAVVPSGHRDSLHGAAAALIVLTLLTGSALTSCSAAHDSSSGAGATMPTMDASTHVAVGQAPADAAEAWAAKPAFVSVNQETEEAYAFALYHPEVLRWMPCYCGCAAMNHRSNLDCYLRPTVVGGGTTFEEHASYCDLCVKITLLTKHRYAQGASLAAIRQAVDQTFGGAAPGTETDLPPA